MGARHAQRIVELLHHERQVDVRRQHLEVARRRVAVLRATGERRTQRQTADDEDDRESAHGRCGIVSIESWRRQIVRIDDRHP
jgi:hypothetical protein